MRFFRREGVRLWRVGFRGIGVATLLFLIGGGGGGSGRG